MSNLSGLGSSAASYYATALQQLQQRLFSKIDANGDGTVSQSELETAVTKAGGTTKSADALYAALDPNNTGGVSEPQFAQNLPLPAFSPAMGAQLIADQAQMCGTSASTDPASFSKQNLFTQLDANGDGSLTKTELEQAVTKAGGTVASADALYAKLDPTNTGSVSAQQFVQNLPTPHHHHHHGGGAPASDALSSDASTGSDTDNSAQDALAELLQSVANATPGTDGTATATATDPSTPLQNLFSQLDSNGDGSLTKTELEQAVTKAGGTTQAADALYAKLDPTSTGSVSAQQFVQNLPGPHHHHHHGGGAEAASASTPDGSTTTDGNSPEDALLALLQNLAPQAGTTTAASTSDPLVQSTDGSTTTATTLASLNANTAQAALQALLGNFDTPSQLAGLGTSSSTGTAGSSADDALLALLNADGTGQSARTTASAATANASSNSSSSSAATSQASTPASLFSKVSQQVLALMLQIQSQSFAG
jgi:Ca2+-binding EF-hand superfamily protein